MRTHPNDFDLALEQFDAQAQRRKNRKQPLVLRGPTELAPKAHTFNDWLELFFRADAGSELEKLALNKISRLRASNQKLLDAIEFAPSNSPMRAIVERRLAKRGVTELYGYELPFEINLIMGKHFSNRARRR